MVELLRDPVFIGVVSSVVFGVLKRTELLKLARSEVRFLLAVLLAGIAGFVTHTEPDLLVRLTAAGQSAMAAVMAYQGWKHIVLGMVGRLFGGWFGDEAQEAIDREVERLRRLENE